MLRDDEGGLQAHHLRHQDRLPGRQVGQAGIQNRLHRKQTGKRDEEVGF